jgi:hypothetical protein
MITISIINIKTVLIDPDEGISVQHANVLLNQDDTTYYRLGVGGLDPAWSQAQVQADLDSRVDELWAAAVASGAPPLTAEEISDINDIISLQADIDLLATYVALINDVNGLKDQLKNTAWNALPDTNAKLEAMRSVLRDVFTILAPDTRLLRQALKWQKRTIKNQ